MKTFKIILNTFLVVVFIASTLISILLFSSSYGSLMFRKDKNLLNSMLTVQSTNFSYSNFMEQKDVSYTFDTVIKEENKKADIKIVVAFNKDGDMSYSETCINDACLDVDSVLNYISIVHTELYSSNKVKTKMDFSFSPFYTFGIKVDAGNIEANYDLKGNLRKVKITEEKKSIIIKISKGNKKINAPDLSNY